MAVKVNPPPQLKIPKAFLADAEVRNYFEQEKAILFQLWQRTGGSNDFINQLTQIPVINIENSDYTMDSSEFGSLVTIDASSVEVNLTLPVVTNDDIGKSIIVAILDDTNDSYVFEGGASSVLGESSVLMNEQFLSVHFTAISTDSWIAV